MTIEPGVEQTMEVREAAPTPNPWVSKTIDLGTPVHYADFGGSGPVMVLVHGIASSHLNWMGVGTELAKRARVYAVDLPGYGLSPRSPEPATVETSQRYLDRFIDAVSPQAPVTVFGHSMGGLVALMQTTAHPEKISRLILMSPAAPYPRRSLISFFAFPFILAMLMPKRSADFLQKRGASLEAETVVRQALKRITAKGARLPEDIVQAHIDLLNRQRKEHDWTEQALIESAGSLVKTTARRRAYRRLVHSVRAPTLLLHGSKDRLVPYQAGFRLAHERPDWTFRPLIGLGHMPQMEDADRVMSEVNQWLDQQVGRPATV
ncbi:MAG: alpha/beta hydrolase [Candidatus Dormibacteraeota bacterium]|nr:alpha/beta hydrolase [Candidatus Dormibacteraeota bacterium]